MTGMQALRTAAPFLSQFRGQIFVVKLGGEVLDAPNALKSVAEQLALFWHLGMRIVLVHGGGTSVDALSKRLDLPIEKVNGRRVTSPEVLEAVKMTLAGQVHVNVLAAMRQIGLPVVGLTGVDAGLIKAEKRPPVKMNVDGKDQLVDFGAVGDVKQVHPEVIEHLLQGGYMPVIAPLSGNDEGDVFNTNADTVAATLAASLGAEKLMFVLRVPGLLKDVEQPNSLIPFLGLAETQELIGEGVASGGMLPKLAAAKTALESGVKAVHLVSAFAPDALLIEVFTNEGSGTMIRKDI